MAVPPAATVPVDLREARDRRRAATRMPRLAVRTAFALTSATVPSLAVAADGLAASEAESEAVGAPPAMTGARLGEAGQRSRIAVQVEGVGAVRTRRGPDPGAPASAALALAASR